MKTKTTTILLLAALFIGSAAAQQAQQDTRASINLDATFINSDPVPLQSGESGDITFKVRNIGDTEASDVQVQLVDNYPFNVKPDRKTNYSLGNVAPGQEYQISTEVLVSDDAPDGANGFKIRIINNDFSRTLDIPVEVQSQDIELNVANLQTQPGQLMPDTDNNVISVDVVNNGEKTAENVVLDLNLPGFFERTSSFSTRQSLGNLQSGQVKTADFNFDINETAPAGSVTIDGDLQYSPGDSTSKVAETVGFDLYLEGKPQFRIEEVESNLKTGTKRELRLSVRNIGEEKSSSTRIRVLDSSDQPFSYDSSSKYIGTLESGQTGQAVFEVDTDSDAAIKNYLVDFEVRGVRGTEVFVEDSTVQTEVTSGQTGSSRVPFLVTAAILFALIGGIYYFREQIKALA